MLKRRDVLMGTAGAALLGAATVDAAPIATKHRDDWLRDFYDESAAFVAGRKACACVEFGRLPHGSPAGGSCDECGGAGVYPPETWDSPGASPALCASLARDLTGEVANLLARLDVLGLPGGLSGRARAFTLDLRERIGPELVRLRADLLELGQELDAALGHDCEEG